MSGEIRILRVITGEQVIGTVSEKDGKITINKPMAVRTSPKPDGTLGVALMDWLPLMEGDELELPDSFMKEVVLQYKPESRLTSMYKQHTTGLITADTTLQKKLLK